MKERKHEKSQAHHTNTGKDGAAGPGRPGGGNPNLNFFLVLLYKRTWYKPFPHIHTGDVDSTAGTVTGTHTHTKLGAPAN